MRKVRRFNRPSERERERLMNDNYTNEKEKREFYEHSELKGNQL